METVKLDSIVVRGRLRDVDEGNDEFKALLESIRSRGILQPVLLVKLGNSRPHLVAGMHRLTALRSIGKTELRQGHEFVWLDTKGMSPRQIVTAAQFAEIHENVRKVNLSPRQHAKFIIRAGQLVTREKIEEKRAQLVEERRKTEQKNKEAAEARRAAKEAEERLAKAREAAEKATAEKRKRAEEAAEKARKELAKRNEAAAEAERERNRQQMMTERLRKSLAIHPGFDTKQDTTLSSSVSKVDRATKGFNATLAQRLDLTPSWVKQVRLKNSSLRRFITDEQLEAHPICEKIDRQQGEYSTLLEMAQDSCSFYHKGLKQWCDDVRARKNVLMPSALKQKIKEQEAEARRAELRQNEKAAFRTAVSDFRGIVSTFKAFKAKVVGNHSKSPHARVQELARREMQVIDRIMQALEDMNTRIDGVVAAHKSDDGNA